MTKHVDKHRDYVNVLVCKSNKNKTKRIFPLLKERVKEESDSKTHHKVISKMHLIEKKNNRKDIFNEEADETQLLEAFFVTMDSFGENKDNYMTVTERFIKVYDKDMNLRLKFEGLNIRSCQQVH